jgi:hypothetical protein
MYDEVFQAVRTLALAYAAPYTAIDHGAMPQENGLAMYPGPGYVAERHFDRGGVYDVSVVLNGKHSNLGTLLPSMSNVHRSLSTLTAYPEGAGWKILSIETSTPPNYLDRETSGSKQWLYGSILAVKFYVKGA